MIEIVCPSCDARYQLPDGSIGPDGRNVSCSNCSHKWRAYAAGDEVEAEAGPAPAAPAQPSYRPNPAHSDAGNDDAATVAAAMAAVSAADQREATAGAAPAPAAGDREQQMDAIRKMLADLKEGAEAADAAVPEPVAKPVPEAPSQPVRRRDSDEDSDRDALKSRIDDLTKMGKAAKGEAGQTGFDTLRLRKLHEKRAKKLQKARERRKKSGAFMTGFSLVAVVTLTMVGLYVMKPQIVAASPDMAPAMDEYVVTIDRYRVELNEKTGEWREWLTERIAKLRGEEEQGSATQ